MAIIHPNNVINEAGAARVWDSVAHLFELNNQSKITYAPGKDNYEAIWPVLTRHIFKRSSQMQDCRVCDFGCGTGLFSESISKMGYKTYAYDISPKMIQQACRNSDGNVEYVVGGIEEIRANSPFNVLIAIMVFQFIDYPKYFVERIRESLSDGGIFFFSVHNIEYAYECLEHKVKFRNLYKYNRSTYCAEILIGDCWIDTFLRTPDYYDGILSAVGFTKIGESLDSFGAPLDVLNHEVGWNSAKYITSWYKL